MKYKVLITTLLISLAIGASADSDMPDDINRFIENRNLCDHFRGEPAYDDERREFLIKNMNEFCLGSDLKLFNLKNKYKDNDKIMQLLSVYENDIEPNK